MTRRVTYAYVRTGRKNVREWGNSCQGGIQEPFPPDNATELSGFSVKRERMKGLRMLTVFKNHLC